MAKYKGHTTNLLTKSAYSIWSGMKQRCYNRKNQNYRNYGGRGIEVCPEWLDSFDAFFNDMGVRPPGTSLERKDNHGHYEPGNCKWATYTQQARNKRSNALNEEEVAHLKWMINTGRTRTKTIAQRLDVTQCAVTAVRLGRTWKEIESKQQPPHGEAFEALSQRTIGNILWYLERGATTKRITRHFNIGYKTLRMVEELYKDPDYPVIGPAGNEIMRDPGRLNTVKGCEKLVHIRLLPTKPATTHIQNHPQTPDPA